MAYKAGSLVVDILANDQVSTTLDKIGNKIGAFGTKSNRLAKNGGGFGFLKIAKWTAVFAVARRFGRVLGNIVQSGADYTETLNLWETAMGSNLNVATEFVNKMNEAYGISEKTLMNAQAIFKNMLGSLGQISDTMAYSLSEGITQMALDYASLYNVTFEKAFTKFQAALAGQVRPIRSVAGYDITENTLFQLYQSLGGTKTMRQLTRTEKQLLSILAIFNQMTASGAVGDLDKTMSSFANQSRVWKESLVEVKNWLGVILTYTIQESGIMVKLNAMLITVARYLETVAKQIGAIQHFENDPFAGTEQSAIDASKAVDELQGKLLDFDKFRSLSGAEENALGLDEKLLNALSGYDTILGNASNEARELSDQWFKAWGFTINANGELELTNEQLSGVKDKLNSIINFLGTFDGKKTLETITPLMSTLLTTLKELLPIITTISQTTAPIILNLAKAVGWIIDLADRLGILKGAIALIIGFKIGSKISNLITSFASLFIKTNAQTIAQQNLNNVMERYLFIMLRQQGYTPLQIQNMKKYAHATQQTTTQIKTQTSAIQTLSIAITAMIASYTLATSVINSFDGEGRKIASVCFIIVGAIMAVVGALVALKTTQSWGLGLPILLAGIGAAIAGVQGLTTNAQSGIDMYANGGLPDKGTLYYAGEAGAEIVYNTPSGQSGVANIQQIEQAMYGALVRYGKSNGGNGQSIEVYLDGEKV